MSPREIYVAVTQMTKTDQAITVESVAHLVAETRGERSQRQHRNASEWRALGALLTLRGLDGSPEGQRAFIGDARHYAGKRPTDLEILRVAMTAAELGVALDTSVIGKVTRRLSAASNRLAPEELRSAVQHEIRMLRRESTRGIGRISGTRPTGLSSSSALTRKWRPGGRRNRTVRRGLRGPE